MHLLDKMASSRLRLQHSSDLVAIISSFLSSNSRSPLATYRPRRKLQLKNQVLALGKGRTSEDDLLYRQRGFTRFPMGGPVLGFLEGGKYEINSVRVEDEA